MIDQLREQIQHSKLAQTGEAQKAERGYRIAPAAEAAPAPSSAPAAAGEWIPRTSAAATPD